MDVTVDHLRDRIRKSPVSQTTLARAAGYQPAAFSRYLSGQRRIPTGFCKHVATVLRRLETAQQAAAEARDRVLAGPPEAA